MAGRGRILVADDDQAAAHAIGRVLKRRNFDVEIVGSGAEAQTADPLPDLLIADIYMPGNVNLELLQWEPVRSGALPLILVTGQPTVATAIRALRTSVVDYVTKPIDPAYLVERIELTLRARQASQQVAEATAQIGRLLRVLQSAHDLPASEPEGPDGRADRALASLSADQRAALSSRERDVVVALVRHGSLAAVSRDLAISPHTVRGHLASVFRKLEVRSQVELVAKLMGQERG